MSVIVNGVDLQKEYGLYLLKDSEFLPPKPKLYYLDVPGSNGSLDVSECFGEVLYENRKDTFIFHLSNPTQEIKNQIIKFLHGKTYSYTLSFDKGYTFTGRFNVISAHTNVYSAQIKCEVISKPYKSAGRRSNTLNAKYGVTCILDVGQGRSCPVFECERQCQILWNNRSWIIPAGKHKITSIGASLGFNEIYLCTQDLPSATINTWHSVSARIWSGVDNLRYHELREPKKPAVDPSAGYDVTITYEKLEI